LKILSEFEEFANQFEEVPQSCHRFGEELPVSLKKCHSATAGLEKSHCRIRRGHGWKLKAWNFLTFLFILDFAKEYL
jgi:hypothetical protein